MASTLFRPTGTVSRAVSRKEKGEGLTIRVNYRWCNPAHITIKEWICGPHIELCAVGLSLGISPCGLGVYVPLSAIPTAASDTILSAIAQSQTQHLRAFIAISNDINYVNLDITLPTQYVVCPTRGERIFDLRYVNFRVAYSSSFLTPLIHLTPCCGPIVKREPLTTISISDVCGWL